MNFDIVYTDNFARELKQLAKKHRSIKNDLSRLLEEISKNPMLGTPLGNDCFKIRMVITSKGKGKSGGARVITHVYVSGTTVYLLSVYDKSNKDNLSDKELKSLLDSI